mmetsp:Transcript_6151/g.13500  ORF Transcript_6151/g.13500 Transcript_6151/m.13500 type:complete len:370 (-) Transcript_6151:40-1149(-)
MGCRGGGEPRRGRLQVHPAVGGRDLRRRQGGRILPRRPRRRGEPHGNPRIPSQAHPKEGVPAGGPCPGVGLHRGEGADCVRVPALGDAGGRHPLLGGRVGNSGRRRRGSGGRDEGREDGGEGDPGREGGGIHAGHGARRPRREGPRGVQGVHRQPASSPRNLLVREEDGQGRGGQAHTGPPRGRDGQERGQKEGRGRGGAQDRGGGHRQRVGHKGVHPPNARRRPRRLGEREGLRDILAGGGAGRGGEDVRADPIGRVHQGEEEGGEGQGREREQIVLGRHAPDAEEEEGGHGGEGEEAVHGPAVGGGSGEDHPERMKGDRCMTSGKWWPWYELHQVLVLYELKIDEGAQMIRRRDRAVHSDQIKHLLK